MKRPVKLVLGFVIGTVVGIFCHLAFGTAPWVEVLTTDVAQPIGQVFLRLIFSIVVPLVFSSLVLGVYELGDMKSVGRIGWKTLAYTLFASVCSVVIGLTLVEIIRPGTGLPANLVENLRNQSSEQSTKVIGQAKSTKGIATLLVELIPKNPLSAAVNALEGEMVSLMVFALIFGAALVSVRGSSPGDALVKFLESIRDVSLRIVDFAMALAPFGVAALMFSLTAKFGWGLLFSLGKYVAVVLLGLAIQQFVVFGLMLKLYAKRSPWQFLVQIREVIVTAFSTASSNATLPTSLEIAERELKLDRRISSFVLTIGATANQNGTALFEGVTILFLAQVFGVDLTLTQQIIVLFMSVVAGIGTAGVPGGSLPLIVIVLQSVHIPPEGIGLIMGVDRFLDMCRTVLNVTGDLVAATVIDASEKREPSYKRAPHS